MEFISDFDHIIKNKINNVHFPKEIKKYLPKDIIINDDILILMVKANYMVPLSQLPPLKSGGLLLATK